MSDLTASPAQLDPDLRVTRIAAPLRHSVVESIRNAIALGHLQAGQRLTEKALCEMTGVSRTLVREALRQLESEGLIDVVPHRGPFVARLTPEQAEYIYQVRRELEGLAAELFATLASAEEQKALKKALRQLTASFSNKDPAVRLNAKNEFYACLLRGSGNAILAQVLSLLNGRIVVLRATSLQQQGRARESIRELNELVEAVLARDPAAAREAARRHVASAAAAALAIMRGQAAN
ncbi:GntR family transcriptional regulator [Pigmentiphaga soli]|uniref:GntR family transcriptional regulator n=1 Tax=Pigmentiphaga soli TaxID=1007095 RepID=A0ABP8GLE9_9BURK